MVNYKGYPIVIGGQDIYDPYTNKVEYFEGSLYKKHLVFDINIETFSWWKSLGAHSGPAR